MNRCQIALLGIGLMCLLSRPLRADDNAKQAYAVLKKYCAACHHDKRLGNKEYDVLDYESLVSTKPSERIRKRYPAAASYIKPGSPTESLILLRVAASEMPPKGRPQPAPAEKSVLRRVGQVWGCENRFQRLRRYRGTGFYRQHDKQLVEAETEAEIAAIRRA